MIAKRAEPAVKLCNQAAPIPAADFARLTIPYGDYPVALPDGGCATQRFTPESARSVRAALASQMKSGKSKGIPVYHGHPDVPALAARYPDKRAYGWIGRAEADADGLHLYPAWNEEPGNHFSHISPYWWCRRRDYAVTRIESVALTNAPNIPDLRLPNESAGPETQTRQGEETMFPELLKLLGLPEDAEGADALAAVKALQTKAADLEAAAEAARAEAAKAAEGLANERAARVKTALDHALEQGRVTAAGRPAWERRLTEDPEAGYAALANEKPQLKAAAKTDGLKKPAASHADVIAMANEKVAASAGRLSFLQAYGEIKRDRPELFGG